MWFEEKKKNLFPEIIYVMVKIHYDHKYAVKWLYKYLCERKIMNVKYKLYVDCYV